MIRRPLIASLAAALTVSSATGNGVYRNGAGGRSMALNGAVVASPGDPVGVMASNPAGLVHFDEPAFALGLFAAYGDAEFHDRYSGSVSLHDPFGIGPEAGLALPLGEQWALGWALIPEAARRSAWRYLDQPGGATGVTSYGVQETSSEFASVRTSLGLSRRIGDRLAVGASAGLVYEIIDLKAPYIVQSNPSLKGVKALLDLQTEGFAANADLGALYRVNERLHLGLNYRTETDIDSHGSARGDAGAQLRDLGASGLRRSLDYDAEVETTLPRAASGGFAFQATPELSVMGAVEWINWGDAYDELTVNLTRGRNADVNGLAGGDQLLDSVPLGWSDRWVYRIGLEHRTTDDLTLRLGYSYGANPIPDENLTPLNAAIGEHTLSAGVGFKWRAAQIDLAYQYDLPNREQVGRSNLQAGEYSHSSVEVGAHWFGATVTFGF